MSYMNIDNLTDSTSTYSQPTAEECRKEIVFYSKMYSQKKWYQPKKYLLEKIKLWAKRLIEVE